MSEVTIYTKPWCPYCWRAKRLLDAKGVVFTELDVIDDPNLETEMIRRSGRTTAPQIFVNGEHIGDSDRLMQLENDGELDAILKDGPQAAEG